MAFWKAKYEPTIGIVTTTTGKIDDMIDAWMPLLEDANNVDFVVVESETDKETSMHNREICLNRNLKRHWVPKFGKWGKSHARNYGASKVNGEYLWFVDGDCFPFESALKELRYVAGPEVVVCGRVNFPQENGAYFADHRTALWDSRDVTPTNYFWAVEEGNMCYPRTLFNSVGGFDVGWAESGHCPEGVDLWWRIFCRHFTPLMLVPAVAVEHQWHPPSEERLRLHENIEPLKRRLQQTAMDAGLWEHPKIQEMFDAVQGDFLLDGR